MTEKNVIETTQIPDDQPGKAKKALTTHDLGWTDDYALQVRGLFSAIADDWDDPSMDDLFDDED